MRHLLKLNRTVLVLCWLAHLSMAAGEERPVERAASSRHGGTSYATTIKPLLDHYCFACHGNGKKKGDVALDQWRDESETTADIATWQRVLKKIQDGEMPPENKPQPSPDERLRLTKWIETTVLQCDCNHPDPGRAPIRRLNRAEYNNTIRDLLGVDFKPADDFPVDDSGYGFDNMADALSLSPVLFEKYLAASEKIVNAAFVLHARPQAIKRRFPVDALEVGYNARQRGDGWVYLNSIEEDDVAVDFQAPAGGVFAVRVHAYAVQQSSNAIELTFMLGSSPIRSVAVQTNPATTRVYQTRATLAPGKNRVRAVVRRVKDGLSEEEALKWKSGANQKGAVFLEWLEIEGPLAMDTELPESHRNFFATKSQIGTDRAVATDLLGRFARRAFRRPVSRIEVDRLVQLAFEAWRRGDSFEQGVARAVQAVLVSPEFLFRSSRREEALFHSPEQRTALSAESSIRSGSADKAVRNSRVTSAATGAVVEVDEFTLASRLSYFLWSSMPDDNLFALAEKGELRRNLDAEVRRMLRDAKAIALVKNFAGQWLQLRNLELLTPDKTLFPTFDEELRACMRIETEMLFLSVHQRDASILDFVRADYTFVNERLAKHYGLSGVKGPEFQPVSLEGTPRRGVLAHASILALTSNPTRTSPVKRGKWVLETLLNAPPPPPPPNVPELKEGKELTGTLRQRMEQHRSDALCASCHARMDPIGFALENFDALGAWREKDGQEPIDAMSELASGEKIQGATGLVGLLGEKRKEQFVRCFAEKLLTYALGRGVEFTDKCALDEITSAATKEDYRFSSVIKAIVKSTPFQKMRIAADESQVYGSEKTQRR